MKELLVFRHAKAEKRNGTKPDKDRALEPQGMEDAQEIGGQLAAEALLPDLVICSDTRRAAQTYESASKTWAGSRPLQMTASLYNAEGSELFSVVASAAGESDRVMLVGHNPAFERFIELATGSSIRLKTGTVAILKIDIDNWKEFGQNTGARLKSVISPAKDS